MRRFLPFAAALLLAACGQENTPAEEAPPAPHDAALYVNGLIYTGLEDFPTAEAVAVSDGVILAVGTRDIIEESAGDGAKVIDLGGAVMFPGFTDAHAHLINIGQRELSLNLEDAGSIAALVAALSSEAAKAEPGATIIGLGWIETGWPEDRMPTRDDLDPASPDNPVLLWRADGHALIANSAALDAAGIDDATPDPDGGKIERDASGRATGILIDTAMALVEPLISAPTETQLREMLAKGAEVYAAYGWTGLHNMSVPPEAAGLIAAMSEEGAIGIRVYNALTAAGLDMLVDQGVSGADNGRVITRAVKLYMDGALGSRGALLTEPYSDRPDMRGLSLLSEDDARAYFDRALESDIQIVTHAIGDEGNKLLLDWYEAAFARHPEKTDMRWRDEHTQILHTEDIPRFAELGVIPSMQPSHAIGDLYFAPDRLGGERLAGAYAWRSLIDAGAIIAGGSDAPVERGDPRIEFYAAVARRGLDGAQTEDWRPQEAVTREEALKMFTIWPAYASFQEDMLGTIEPGKRADFTVFSKDLMTVPAEEILTAETVMTVVDGEIIYDGR